MAIELPPPLPPQAVPADELRTVANARTIEFKTYRVHLPANGGLDAAQVRRAIAGAVTVDEAVSALAQAYYADGRLSDQLLYAVDAQDIYLAIYRRRITAVQAPPALQPYFEPLLGAPLTDSALEPRRALANVDADRAGIAAQARLQATEGGDRKSTRLNS